MANTRAKQEMRNSEKHKRKSALKAQYAAWTAAGQNKKSKRYRKQGMIKTVVSRTHPVDCGNVSCLKCYEPKFSPFLDKKGIPRNMPQGLYQKWKALSSKG